VDTCPWIQRFLLYLYNRQHHNTHCRLHNTRHEHRQYGSIFIRLAVVTSQTCQLVQNSAKMWTYNSSRSSKVDDFGTNRKSICHFLLVINSNFGPILHRFWDTATYWLKIAHFHTPSVIRRPRSISSLSNFTARLGVRKLESWGYSVVKVAWSLLQPSLTDPPVWQTDGQTDGRWHIARYSIYAVARLKRELCVYSTL